MKKRILAVILTVAMVAGVCMSAGAETILADPEAISGVTAEATPTPNATSTPFEMYFDFNDGLEGWYGNDGGGHSHVTEGGIGNSGVMSVTSGNYGFNSGYYDLTDLVPGNIYEITGKVKLAKQNNVGEGRIFVSIIYCYFDAEKNEWSYKALSAPSIVVLSNKEIQNESADGDGFCDIAFEFIAPAMDEGYDRLDKGKYPPYKFDILCMGSSSFEYYLDDLKLRDVTATSSFGKETLTPVPTQKPTPIPTQKPTPTPTPTVAPTDDALTSGDYKYVVNHDQTVEITKYIGKDNVVSVPSSINGMTVTSIGDRAFAKIGTLQSVILPETLTKIGDYAFESCEALANVSISNGVKTIGDYAFYNCKSLWSVTVPDSVSYIGNYAFGYDNTNKVISKFNIIGSVGSVAEKYANDNKIAFLNLSSDNGVTPTKKSIKFTKKSVKIKRGKKVTLKVKITGAKKANFSVNKKGEKVVKLMKKKAKKVTVKGKKKGKAVITAKAAGKKAKCKVTVK